MHFRRLRWFVAAVILLAGCATAIADQQKPEEQLGQKASRFVRMTRDRGGKKVALQTAIVRYQPADATKTVPTVDLIAAVHVGEKNYYRRLNQKFKQYDAVLYEIVAPRGTRIPRGGGEGSGSAVSMLQRFMKNVLELGFQLEEIDYTRKNLVHADMSPEQFARSMKERDESMLGMTFRMMGHAIAQQSGPRGQLLEAELLMAFFSRDRALALKRVLAEQMEDVEKATAALTGPKGSTIVTERNKVALKVLREQIEGGKKKLAIFYGAGHMPDIEKRLDEEFGLRPAKTTWLDAWDLRDPSRIEPPRQPHAPTGAKEAAPASAQ